MYWVPSIRMPSGTEQKRTNVTIDGRGEDEFAGPLATIVERKLAVPGANSATGSNWTPG